MILIILTNYNNVTKPSIKEERNGLNASNKVESDICKQTISDEFCKHAEMLVTQLLSIEKIQTLS